MILQAISELLKRDEYQVSSLMDNRDNFLLLSGSTFIMFRMFGKNRKMPVSFWVIDNSEERRSCY